MNASDYEGIYDRSAGSIKTPHGIGKFVEYNPHTKKVTVELDYMHLCEFDGAECYPMEEA